MDLGEVSTYAEAYRNLRSNAKSEYEWMVTAMREARAAGASLAKLSEASGLSIAQVQRICDLSKDRSE